MTTPKLVITVSVINDDLMQLAAHTGDAAIVNDNGTWRTRVTFRDGSSLSANFGSFDLAVGSCITMLKNS